MNRHDGIGKIIICRMETVNRTLGRLALLFLLMMHPASMMADYYDTDLLMILSKILPRIVSMSSLDPSEGVPIRVCIVHEDVDRPAAEHFETLLKRNSSDGGDVHGLQSKRTDFSHMAACGKSQLIFLFDARPATVAPALSEAKKFQAIVAAYNTALLSQGADISLFVGRSVMPYLNLSSLKDKNISLDTILLRVSKIYGREKGQ
jgi:hypothetical protein